MNSNQITQQKANSAPTLGKKNGEPTATIATKTVVEGRPLLAGVKHLQTVRPSNRKVSLQVLQEFPDVKATKEQVVIDGKAEATCLIFKGDTRIAHVSPDYELFPNEYALAAGNEVAKEIGAVPWDQYGGDWFVKAESNVLYAGRHNSQMHALYAFQDDEKSKPMEFEIRKGDKIQMGFSLHNSIDGRMGLGAGIWTFRHACQNMFFMGFKGRGMSFDDRNVLAYFYKSHVTEMSKEQLKAIILRVVDAGIASIAALRAMDERKLTQAKAERLVKIIGMERAIECMPYVEIDEKDKVTLLPEAASVTDYDAWNDVTYAITQASEMNTKIKMKRYAKIQRVLVENGVGKSKASSAADSGAKRVV